jgi:hypothetical protein
MKEYHIFYFIVCVLNDRFKGIYGGIHSTKNIEDSYLGSGVFLKKIQKEYGVDNFFKFNFKFFENREDALEYENGDYEKYQILQGMQYAFSKFPREGFSFIIKEI